MAAWARAGTFSGPTATGNFTTTPAAATGLTAQALILWGSMTTADGYLAGVNTSFGFAASSTAREFMSMSLDDNVAAASAVSRIRASNDRVGYLQTTAGSIRSQLEFVSFGADGAFTLNQITTTPPSAYKWNYLVIGGVTAVSVGDAVGPATSGGTADITAPGFQPDLVLVIGVRTTGAYPASGTGADWSLGAMDGAGNQACSSIRMKTATNPTDVSQYQKAGRLLLSGDNTTGDPNLELTGSILATGFRMTANTNLDPAAYRFGYLALQGLEAAVLTETQKTSTGTKATTGAGLAPVGALLFGNNAASNASVDKTQMKLSIGGADSSGTEAAMWASGVDNVATSDSNMRQISTKAMTHSTSVSTTNAEADIASWDTDGVTLDWTTADATAREFVMALIGNPAPVATNQMRMII